MRSDVAPFLLLLALNLSICWRLFKVDFTDQFSSIEGAWIGMARYLSRHWGDSAWWPLWHCGMPFQDTYVPLLHVISAAVATAGHLSAGRAYHGVIGMTYALGAPTLYWMAVRLGARRGAAFLGALCYSLFSPSVLFMPNVARDVGGYWFARRLQVIADYGEGPHISAMTLLPVVILALQNALTRKTLRTLALAAIAMALVFVTNIPGTMALSLAVFCWICAQPWERHFAAWRIAVTASVLAYGLACYGVPPSSAFTVGGNVGAMHRGFSNSLKHGPVWLLLAFGCVLVAGYGLQRTRVPLATRFAFLYFALVAPMAVTARIDTFELLPQVGRLHLELEMGFCLMVGGALWAMYERVPAWGRPLLLALCLAPVVVQTMNYRTSARSSINAVDLQTRSEYTTSRWLDENLHGGRVYASGSLSFWLNAFSDTPQLIGCCDQGLAMPALADAAYKINTDAGPIYTEAARAWLLSLGVDAFVVSGPESTDEYKDFQHPERFEAGRFAEMFPVLHREHGDTVFQVAGQLPSLAHVIRPEERLAPHPGKNVDYPDVLQYWGAIAHPGREQATFQWLHNGAARIRAKLRKDDLLAVRVAGFPGWKATQGGARRTVSVDALGFLVVAPECEGECTIDLTWTGRPDLPWAAAISLLAMIGVVVMLRR